MKTTLNDIKLTLYRALALAEVDSELLAIVGSWIDTASDEETLGALRRWSADMEKRKSIANG